MITQRQVRQTNICSAVEKRVPNEQRVRKIINLYILWIISSVRCVCHIDSDSDSDFQCTHYTLYTITNHLLRLPLHWLRSFTILCVTANIGWHNPSFETIIACKLQMLQIGRKKNGKCKLCHFVIVPVSTYNSYPITVHTSHGAGIAPTFVCIINLMCLQSHAQHIHRMATLCLTLCGESYFLSTIVYLYMRPSWYIPLACMK